MTATALYLANYKSTNPSLLAPASSNIIPPTLIDPSATIDPSAKIGPNVAIGPNVTVRQGVRIKDAIVLEGSTLEKHSCVLNSIVGTNSHIGAWSRVDGEQEFEKEVKGKISVTILASEVSLAPETMVRSCIVLPNVRQIIISNLLQEFTDNFFAENAYQGRYQPSSSLTSTPRQTIYVYIYRDCFTCTVVHRVYL